MAMPYGEHRIRELQQSADITPIEIQLETNAEIFRVVYNLIWNTHSRDTIDFSDLDYLNSMWLDTIQELARIEMRKGYYVPMDKQIEMLHQAYIIERKYMPDQVFSLHIPVRVTRELIEKEGSCSKEELQTMFQEKVLPAATWNKTGGHKRPMAFIMAGQPGSGKSRMASMFVNEWQDDVIIASSDKFRGFHPRYEELQDKYGQYCPFYTREEGHILSGFLIKEAIRQRHHLLYECSLLNIDSVLRLISDLHASNYDIWIILRACPKRISWRSIHQRFLQHRLKAPGLSRIITKTYHDQACAAFLSSTREIVKQNLYDRMIVKSHKGLLYDSDDMPTESVIDILTERMTDRLE